MTIDLILVRSTREFSSPEYGVVRQCRTTTASKNSRKTSAEKWGPLSERICAGASNRPKCLIRHCVADLAVASGV